MDNHDTKTIKLLNGLDLCFDFLGFCTSIHNVLPTGLSVTGVIIEGPLSPTTIVRSTKKYEIKLKTRTADFMVASNESFELPNNDILLIDASGIPSIQSQARAFPTYNGNKLSLNLEGLTKQDSPDDQYLPHETIVGSFRILLADFGKEQNRLNEITVICLGLTSKRNWQELDILVPRNSMHRQVWLRMTHGTHIRRKLVCLFYEWIGKKYQLIHLAQINVEMQLCY